MRRLLAVLLLAAVVACDPAGPVDPVAQPTPGDPARGAPSELPAADPLPPSLEAFAAEAAAGCATATAALKARPLRGDPLTSYAKRRDIRAAVQHYSAAGRAWSDAASALFAFGTPDDPRGQRFIAALDVLAMRSRQVAEALANQDVETAQSMLGAAEQARYETDIAGRDLGLGPLSSCGRATPPAAGRQRVPVIAEDFAFRLPDGAFEPGATRFAVRNRGAEEHQLFVVPLRSAGTLAAAVAADRRGEPLGPFLGGRGATSAVVRPGERTTLDVQIQPGPYGFVCFVASPDGTPHAFKGMATEVMVEG